jgi:hypothetical protein
MIKLHKDSNSMRNRYIHYYYYHSSILTQKGLVFFRMQRLDEAI